MKAILHRKTILLLGALVCFAAVAAAFASGIYATVETLNEYGASVGWAKIAMQTLSIVVPVFLVVAIPLTWLGLVLWRRALS